MAVGLGVVLGTATATVGERAAGSVISFFPAGGRGVLERAAGTAATGPFVEWVAWLAGSLVGGWAAARLAPTARTRHALVAGAALVTAGLSDLAALPHPLWLWPLGLATWLSAAWLGAWLARPRPA